MTDKKSVESINVTHYGEDYAKVEVIYLDGEETEFEVPIALAEAIEEYLEGFND